MRTEQILHILLLPEADRDEVLDLQEYEAHIRNIHRSAPNLAVEILPAGSAWTAIPPAAFILADVDTPSLRQLEGADPLIRAQCIVVHRGRTLERESKGLSKDDFGDVMNQVLEFGFAGAFPFGLGSPRMFGNTFVGHAEVLKECGFDPKPHEAVTSGSQRVIVSHAADWGWLGDYLAKVRFRV